MFSSHLKWPLYWRLEKEDRNKVLTKEMGIVGSLGAVGGLEFLFGA